MKKNCAVITNESVRSFLDGHRIAVVGASDRKDSFARTIDQALVDHGYEVVPVNPRFPARRPPLLPDVADIPEPVDGAVIMVGPDHATEAVEDAAAAGVRRSGCSRDSAPGGRVARRRLGVRAPWPPDGRRRVPAHVPRARRVRPPDPPLPPPAARRRREGRLRCSESPCRARSRTRWPPGRDRPGGHRGVGRPASLSVWSRSRTCPVEAAEAWIPKPLLVDVMSHECVSIPATADLPRASPLCRRRVGVAQATSTVQPGHPRSPSHGNAGAA